MSFEEHIVFLCQIFTFLTRTSQLDCLPVSSQFIASMGSKLFAGQLGYGRLELQFRRFRAREQLRNSSDYTCILDMKAGNMQNTTSSQSENARGGCKR